MTKPFSYRGKIITASSKVEAIQQIVGQDSTKSKPYLDKMLKTIERSKNEDFEEKFSKKELEELQNNLAQNFYNNLSRKLRYTFGKSVETIKMQKNLEKAAYKFKADGIENIRLNIEYDKPEWSHEYKRRGSLFANIVFNNVSWNEDFFDGKDIDKIIKWIKDEIKNYIKKLEKKKENIKKKPVTIEKKPAVKKPTSKPTSRPKYTNLQTYKSDLYDALTARGLNSEFAMDYVNGLDNYFMKTHQDIKLLVDEAVREWG